MVWAENHPEVFPVNINKANYWNLLKVPGVGPGSAKKIIKARERRKIRSLDQFTGQRLQRGKIKEFVCF